MYRFFHLSPPPHSTPHLDHSDHGDNKHEAPQCCVLHISRCWRKPHGTPALRLLVSIRRTRTRCPESHNREQAPHSPHCDARQFTGHALVLQARVAFSAGHESISLEFKMVRERYCFPPPQYFLEQADHSVHGDTGQLVLLDAMYVTSLHVLLLHAFVAQSSGHAFPPC